MKETKQMLLDVIERAVDLLTEDVQVDLSKCKVADLKEIATAIREGINDAICDYVVDEEEEAEDEFEDEYEEEDQDDYESPELPESPVEVRPKKKNARK